MLLEQPLEEIVDWPPPGRYVVAAGDGIESIVLVHLLANRSQNPWFLRVAYIGHDPLAKQLLSDLTALYGLAFEVDDPAAVSSRHQAQGLVVPDCQDHRLEAALDNHRRHGHPLYGRPVSDRHLDGVYRPLVRVGRGDLLHYVQRHGLPWRDQPEGESRELLPAARLHAPGFEGSYRAGLERLEGLEADIDVKAAKLIGRQAEITANMIRLPRSPLAELSLPATERVLWQLLRGRLPVSMAGVKRLAHWVKSGQAGQEWHLPGAAVAVLGYDILTIDLTGNNGAALTAQDLLPHTSIRFGRHQLSYGFLDPPDHSVVHIRPLELKVRRALPGDCLSPLGGRGPQRLQDLFASARVDSRERLAWPVVASHPSNQVVWVPGLAVDRAVAIDSGGLWLACTGLT